MRCEVMEGCWRVPPTIVRAHIAACGRGRVSQTRASSRPALILAGDVLLLGRFPSRERWVLGRKPDREAVSRSGASRWLGV